MTDEELRAAYDRCARRMREGESYATPRPTTCDVHIEISRARIVVDREDIQVRCHALKLTLADG